MQTLAIVFFIVAVLSLALALLGAVFELFPFLGDEWPFKLLGLGVVSLLFGISFCLPPYFKDQHRLMEQCMQDHKEYECAGILRTDTRPSTIVVPVEIPTR